MTPEERESDPTRERENRVKPRDSGKMGSDNECASSIARPKDDRPNEVPEESHPTQCGRGTWKGTLKDESNLPKDCEKGPITGVLVSIEPIE
jgi:hypothetical protein